MADLEQHSNSPFSQPAGDMADAAADATLQRPDLLPDRYWDERSGIKVDDLLKSSNELSAFKDEADERAASIPDEYEIALPQDYKLPEGYEIDPANPAWKAGAEYAKANGLTQDQYSDLVKLHLDLEVQKSEVVSAAHWLLETAVGGRGRIDALEGWFKSVLGEEVGAQMSQTLWSPTIIAAFEKLKAGCGQAAAPSNPALQQRARPQARTDGKPADWDKWDARTQRTWQIEQSMRRHA
jgi:hypothetical protein